MDSKTVSGADRRCRWLLAAVAVLAAVVVVQAWRSPPTGERLTVRSLTVTDASGAPRLVLGAGDDRMGLTLVDIEGRERGGLYVGDDGYAGLSVLTARGGNGASLGAYDGGLLLLAAPNGACPVHMSTEADGSVMLLLQVRPDDPRARWLRVDLPGD